MGTHLVMPMGGEGSRFFKEGIIQPKPLIELRGNPFFYWAVKSVMQNVDVSDITFAVLRKHIEEHSIDTVIKSFFPEAEIVEIDHVLPGPVHTCLRAVDHIEEGPVIFNDCDHMFKCGELPGVLSEMESSHDNVSGALLTFESDRPQYSYVSFDADGSVSGTVEKKVVSHSAICGAYCFSSAALYKDVAEEYINSCDEKELYMSGLYNVMIKRGLRIKSIPIDYHCEFGTPKEYEEASGDHANDEIERAFRLLGNTV